MGHTSQTHLMGGVQSPGGSSANQLHPQPSASPPLVGVPGRSHSGGEILFSIGGQERNLGASNFVREKGGSEINLGASSSSSSAGGQWGSDRNVETTSSRVASATISNNYPSVQTGGVAMGGATGYSQVRYTMSHVQYTCGCI